MQSNVGSVSSARRQSAAAKGKAAVQEFEKRTHFFQKQLEGEESLTAATAEQLYQLSGAINAIKPWAFLADRDIFLVRDPESGQMCYCSVMGALGEVFSLHAYVGDESYRLFRRISSGGPITPEEFLASQKGVSVEFVRPSELTPPDRELFKFLGHSPQRGSAAPIFRALRPGFHPWYVTEAEGNLLARCMQALLAFCKAFVTAGGASYWNEPDVYPLLVPGSGQGFETAYAIERMRAPEPPLARPQPAVVDEGRIRKILGRDPTLKGCLEADVFLAAGAVGGKNERKSCICMGMIADKDSGFLFRPELATASQSPAQVLAAVLLNAIDDSKRLPAEVHVKKEECKIMLESLSRQLGITVKVVKRFSSLDHARRAVLGMMNGL